MRADRRVDTVIIGELNLNYLLCDNFNGVDRDLTEMMNIQIIG